MRSFHGIQPVFDEDNLVSHTGLVPVLALAEHAGRARGPVGADERVLERAVGVAGCEVAHGDRRDASRRGQHRRSGRAAGGLDSTGDRRGACTVDDGHVPALVHARARAAAERGEPAAAARAGVHGPRPGRRSHQWRGRVAGAGRSGRHDRRGPRLREAGRGVRLFGSAGPERAAGNDQHAFDSAGDR